MDPKPAANAKTEPKSPENKPSLMEEAVQTLFTTFAKHSAGKDYLTYDQFEKLMSTEVPEFVEKQAPGTIKKLLKDVGNKSVEKIEFTDYFAVFAGLLNGCFQMHHLMKSVQ